MSLLNYKITYLTDYPHYIPLLAEWFYTEWKSLYLGKNQQDVEDSIRTRLNTDRIPLTLIALQPNQVLGTVCLKTHELATHQHLTPWLAGLYVAKPWRSLGLGQILVQAIEAEAKGLGIEKLYLYTPQSESFYAKLGWRLKESVVFAGTTVSLMEKQLG